MRLIGTLEEEKKALAFSLFLKEKKISHHLELEINRDWGSENYGECNCRIWIEEEEQVAEAMKWLELFLKNSTDPLFQQFTLFQPLNEKGQRPLPSSTPISS